MSHSTSEGPRHLQGSDHGGTTEELLPLVYAELRRLAAGQMSRETPQTLQPTALVHEAFLRLVGDPEQEWNSRTHFLVVAGQAMRRILVNRAVRVKTRKHGGEACRIALDPEAVAGERELDPVQFLALHEALERLQETDPRQAQLVSLRYFSGLSLELAARVLGVSTSTAHREWEFAKAWLAREIDRS